MQAFDCGVLIDGIADEPLADARVLVEDGEITEVGPIEDLRAPADAERVDLTGQVVLPGLVDAHLHLIGARSMDPATWATADVQLGTARATADLRRLLAAGFTSVRDLGSASGLGLRAAVNEGSIPGPRVYTSWRALSQTGGHGDTHFMPHEWVADGAGLVGSTLADGADECRREARKRVRDGVDVVKIMTTGGVLSEKDAPDQTQYTDAEVAAIAEEARRAGLQVAAHAQGADGIQLALRNGVDTIEHGFFLDEETAEMMLETGGVLVPTLAISNRIVTEGADYGVPEFALRKARAALEAHFEAVALADEMGVPVALGTDFIGAEMLPHGENAEEAELLVEEAGLSEMDAIRAATSVAAETVPDPVGRVEAGHLADLVALDADPLADVSALRDVAAVFKGGERVSV